MKDLRRRHNMNTFLTNIKNMREKIETFCKNLNDFEEEFLTFKKYWFEILPAELDWKETKEIVRLLFHIHTFLNLLYECLSGLDLELEEYETENKEESNE